jgi:ABC-type Na+ efflux pump permease subunit
VLQARYFAAGWLGAAPVLGWLAGVWMQVVVIFQASRFLVEERKSGGLELLMSTALSPEEIVNGQVRALVRIFRGPVWLLLGVMLFPFVLQWVASSFSRENWEVGLMEGGLVLVMMAYRALSFVVGIYAGGWLSLALSAGSRKPERAPYMVTLYLVLLPIILICVPSLVVYLLALFYARNQVRRNFVQLTRRPYGRGLARLRRAEAGS